MSTNDTKITTTNGKQAITANRQIALPNPNSERILTIVVGEGDHLRSWAVHAAYFSSLSAPLKAKFDAHDPSIAVKLTGEDPVIFNMVRNWVYAVAFSGTGSVPKIDEKEPDPEIEEVKIEEGVAPNAKTPAMTSANATPRQIMELFVLATKLEIVGLKNACVDALFTYYHGPESIYMVADETTRAEGRKPRTREVRRCPNLRDVKYIFTNTVKTSKIRQLLVVSILFFLFGKRGVKRELPAEWQEVLTEAGEIGYEMIRMISTWNWTLGETVPSMKVKDACAFHDGHEHGVTGPCGSVRICGQVSLR